MPTIEDIDFLKKNSIKQSYLFLVDSKDRQKETYPNPSEYIIEFSPPFQNVIGLNVVDAAIPRTMYNIDVYNNELYFFIHSSNYDLNNLSTADFTKATLEPGDYTVQTLTVELNNKLTTYLNNNSNLPRISITSAPLSNPPDIKSRLLFSAPYPFILDMNRSSVAESLGFDGHIRLTEYNLPPYDRNYDPYRPDKYPSLDPRIAQAATYYRQTKTLQEVTTYLVQSNYPDASNVATNLQTIATNNQLFHSVDIPFTSNAPYISQDTFTLFEGPRGVIRQEPLTRPLAQKFTVPFQTNVTQIYAALSTSFVSTSNFASFTIQEDNNGIPSGIPLTSGNIAVSFIDGSLSDSTLLAYPLHPQSYWIVFSSNPTLSLYYNDTLSSETTFKQYNDPNWTNFDNIEEDIYYQLSIRVDVCNEYHKLKAPGIYSLIGERYIVLRCREIEENSFRSLSYSKYSLGIAKFRLGVVGYREERLDYSSVPNREFHPIGKLTRLTLRFETANGRLYDFKDVNHTITFSVQYLEPHSTKEFTQSLINANYDGDFMKYKYHQEEQEDEEDEIYSKDDFSKYKINEARNLPYQVAQRNLQMYYDLNYPEEEEEEEA
jgi:hypothetical protein